MRFISRINFIKRQKTIKCTVIFIVIVISFQTKLFGQNFEKSFVPVSRVFHNIGWNALHAITYNYGFNFISAGLETFVFIETGLDWKWRNVLYNNTWLSKFGRPGLYIGYVVPAITPLITYISGRFIKDEKLQITGLALAQSLVLTLGIQSPLKMITGRALPGIVTEVDHTRNSRTEDFSNEFDWFNFNFIRGWPSGHTANAFAAAATIAEIYSDNIPLKIAVYSYAALIGFGTTLNVHWASEAIAGALIGYAIGKTVGRDFNRLLNTNRQENNIALFFTLNSVGIKIHI
ncbi:MAG: phosphatase PAP2 family protein [Treponema sp.]|jgi:membrane-associated phospholipid phosphatase|nr:phosphatase PAP2 family protein [Treponema sp.]